MADVQRPLPNLQELDTRAFWEATSKEKLTYQRCNDFDTVIFYPRRHCMNCLGNSLTWHTATGTGSVYTYSVVRLSYHPFFRQRVPYVVAWIDLDEGPRLLTELKGVVDPDNLKIGQRVKVAWEMHEELAVPLFTLA